MVNGKIETNLDLGNVGLVLIQFKLSDLNGVSTHVRRLPAEKLSEEHIRQERNGTGIKLMSGNISLINFLNEFPDLWYELVGAVSQERSQFNINKGSHSTYFDVKYTFAHFNYVNDLGYHFKDVRNEILSNLKRACVNTVWLGSVFLNSLYKDHKVVKGMNSICVNVGQHNEAKPVKGYKKVKILRATTNVAKRKPKMTPATQPVVANEALQELYDKCQK